MLESDPQKSGDQMRAIAGSDPRRLALLGVAAVLLPVLMMAATSVYGMIGAAMLSLVVFTVVVGIAAHTLPDGHPHAVLGTANIVTLFRASLAAFLAGALVAPFAAPWLIFAVAVFAFALDGLDGYFARKEGLASDFGARFDMEVDAVLAAVLSLVLLARGTVGPEILILGFMRYGFVGAAFIWPWLNAPLRESFRRKAVCVLQIGALIVLLCPIAPTAFIWPLSLVASMTLAWSFAVDILWLKRNAA